MKKKKDTLWSRNFTTITLATIFGAIGNIAGGFALSFLVFAETGSTLAAALTLSLRVIPGFIIPLMVSPIMDRLPRKPFLVCCDGFAAVIYLAMGLFLKNYNFSYVLYLVFSLILATIESFDELSYTALYPKVIPKGHEERGYTISSMLYPVMMVVIMPLAALLYARIGVANILLCQSACCLLAAVTENTIKITENTVKGTKFSIKQWWGDIKEATAYLTKEKGILAFTAYSSVSGGFTMGYEPILVAFFSTTAGFTLAMYSAFTVAQFIGRCIGGALMYGKERPKEKKYGYALKVYMTYDIMDSILLWLPYPLMLINRAICGFLGIQSATMREAATQRYIPDTMRARITAFQSMAFTFTSAILALVVGALGEIMSYKYVLTCGGAFCLCTCMLTIVRNKEYIKKIYTYEPPVESKEETQE